MTTALKPTLQQMIQQSAKHLQTQVSINQMVEFGRVPSQATILRSAQFLHHELPIRIARRVVELENLPYGLSKMSSVQKVANWYSQSYSDLINFPSPEECGIPKSMLREISIKEEEGVSKTENEARKKIEKVKFPPEVSKYNAKFIECIDNIKKRHDPVAIVMAQGIQELKQQWSETKSHPSLEAAAKPYDFTDNNPFRVTRPSLYHSHIIKPEIAQNMLPTDIQAFLDRFYMSRIGIRMLIGQHVALTKASLDGSKAPADYVGIICTRTSIRDVVTQAAENAQHVLQDSFGVFDPPEIKLVIAGSGPVDAAVDDIEFMYCPSHLHHMLFELFKNSLRAIVETHGLEADGEYPPVKVIVAQGKEDITIKISDEGGGIPRSGMPLIWTYLYTTAEKQDLSEDHSPSSQIRAPMAGFGYGLPLSRLYARYFGGNLRLISMEGYGTDAYLHLSRLSDSEEPLPS
ncbi:hypothetical protein HDU98_006748 [Podochytrium sp. JEL0797]|nr:hypothetical protein HDU98_006748 [Podochytrium sp. JEL0797]